MSTAEQPFTESGQGPSGAAVAVRYRAPTWQAAFVICVYVLLVTLVGTQAVAGPAPGEGWSWRLADLCPFVLLAAEGCWLTFRVGVGLTSEAAVVYGFRRRTVPWQEIAQVTAEPFPLGSGRRAVLHLHDGRRIALRQPSTGFLGWDRRFDEKLAAIRSQWLAAGGVPGREDADEDADVRVTAPANSFRIGPSVLQRIYPSLPVALVAADVVVGTDHQKAGTPEHLLGWLVRLVLLGCASRFWFARTSVDRERLVSHDVFGRRSTLRWDEVRSLRLVTVRRAHRIAAVDSGGRTVLLAAPRLGALLWDPEFWAKAEMLQLRWSELSPAAAAASPLTPLAPPVGPRLWQRAVVGVIGLVYGYGVVMALFVGLVMVLIGL